MQKTLCIFSLLLSVSAALYAMPEDFEFQSCGTIKAAGIPAKLVIEVPKSKKIYQSGAGISIDSGYPIHGSEFCEVQGSFKELKLPFFQKVRQSDSDTVLYTVRFAIPENVKIRNIGLDFRLSPALFDNVEYTVDGKKQSIGTDVKNFNCKKLVLPVGNKQLEITGDLKITVQDLRKKGYRRIQLMLHARRSPGKIREWDLAFFLKSSSSGSVQLPLASADTGLVSGKNAVPLLKKYGVTEPSVKCGSLEMALPSETKQILKIDGGKSSNFVLKADKNRKYLYLLHNACKEAAPQIVFTPEKGKPEIIDLKSGDDFSPLCPPRRIANGALALYQQKTKNGLFFSRFTLKNTGAGTLTLKNNGNGFWIVASLVTSGDNIQPANINSIHVIQPDKNWYRMETPKDVEAGTLLDFSGFNHRPAGKFGPVKVDKNGHFYLEKQPGKRIRFIGANIVGVSHIADREVQDKVAENMAKLGYNAVRFHHIDDLLGTKKNSLDFRKDPLDKLDYAFYAMKKQGLYITTDLYTKRVSGSEEPLKYDRSCYKKLVIFDSRYRENWKEYVRRLLGHQNPYTGMTWAEDPALLSVCLINEPMPFLQYEHPLIQEPVQKCFDAYLKRKGIWSEELRKDRSGAEFMRFVVEANLEFTRDATDFLRKELNYKGLITTNNHRSYPVAGSTREVLDIVDNHQYWDHPFFTPNKRKWGFPVLYCQTSALKAGNWLPRTVMAGRIFGKPYTITEYNFTYPNRYRAEGGPLMGGYAALQDWDALFRYSYWGHMKDSKVHQNPINRFDIAEDLISQGAERLMWALFVREDMKAAPAGIAWPFGEKSTYRNWGGVEQSVQPVPFQNLGFYCRIGSLNENVSRPDVKRLSGNPDKFAQELSAAEEKAANSREFTSQTGEITSGPDGCVIVTPKTESITLFGGDKSGKILNVANADSFQSVSVIAMDGKTLVDSGRMLLIHQSDIVNKGVFPVGKIF